MKEAAFHDLKLIGTSVSTGGSFRNIKVTGEAVLEGDTQCRTLSCTGDLTMKGSLRADTLKLTGNCKIEGSARMARWRATGDVEVSGEVHAEHLKMTGDLRIRGNCEAETIRLSGGMTVEGLMNAESIVVHMHGPCKAKEMAGGSVTVKRSRAVLLKKMFGQGGADLLSADLIEGDDVVLDHTVAALVRGNRVTLGPGCEVGRVEYRSELNVGRRAAVKEKVQI